MTQLLGVQIANGFSPEARVFAGLLRHANRTGFGADVLHHDWPGDPTSADRFAAAAGEDITVMRLDFGWRPPEADRTFVDKARARVQFAATLPRAAARARALAAKPTVVYSAQQYWDCQAATYIARHLKLPQIIHLHYIIGPWLHQPVLDRLRTCAHVVTVSDFIRDQALQFGIPADRVTTIRNTMVVRDEPPPGPDRAALRASLGIALDAPLIGIVARLDPNKGQGETIQAFAQIAAKYPDARLAIVGAETAYAPGYAQTIRQIAADAGLSDRVLFLGKRDDVPALLGALDIFAHPSRMDPCPLALLEASAAGLPVVAYAEGGACEIVANGVTGLLTPAPEVDGLAASLDALLADPARARAMGDAGRERMRRDFRPEAAGAAFADLLARAPWKTR